MTRRHFLALGAGAMACGTSGLRASPSSFPESPMSSTSRMPTFFVPHGGGPWPFVDIGTAPGMWDQLEAHLRGLNMTTPERPKAILVVSAHWEEAEPTVMTSPAPPMLYDYHGFPEAAYHVQWPAPGAPELAAQVQDLLSSAGIRTRTDASRGFDHGTFVVTALSDPSAVIPTFQLSLKAGLDPREHLAIGRALAPLRDQGVLILGSGMSYHNMRGFRMAMMGQGAAVREHSKAFDDWLAQTMTDGVDIRTRSLVEWEKAPAARLCHPREEHLLPLMVVAGAGGEDVATLPYRDELMGTLVSSVRFG